MIYETQLQFQIKNHYIRNWGLPGCNCTALHGKSKAMCREDIGMKYEAIVFDLDGTLLDTLEDIGSAANAVLAKNGFPVHATEEYREYVGEGARRLIERALPSVNHESAMIDKCVREYLEEYGRTWAATTRPYDGIDEMLSELSSRGLKLSILSNKTDEFTKKCVAHFFAQWEFDVVVGESEQIPPKPNPKGAFRVAELLRVDRNRILYAGDSGVDMKTAKSAKMFAIGVTWGFRPREELVTNGADVLVSHPMEIVTFVDRS